MLFGTCYKFNIFSCLSGIFKSLKHMQSLDTTLLMISAQNEFKTLIFLTINANTKVMLQFQYKTTFQ